MDEKEKPLKKNEGSIKYSRKCLTMEGEQRRVVKCSPKNE